MKYRLIMNPSSRSGKGRLLWDTWLAQLNAYEVDYEAFVSESIEQCVSLAREDGNFNVAVAVGGDGTVNAVLNGIAGSENKELQLGVLYSGTSPDFCAFHNISIKPEKAVKALVENKCREVDLAEIEYVNVSGRKVTGYFACSCNIGLGRDVAETANRIRKYAGDKLGTGLALAKTVLKGKKYNFQLKINSESYFFESANHLAIIKNPFIASGLKLNFALAPDDRQLGVWVLSGFSRLGMLKLFPGLYNGSAGREGNGIFRDMTHGPIELTGPAGLGIEFDGDHHGYLPLRVRIAERKINLRGSSI
ncbi:MAG: diacylglycerol kinase family protein [Victivallales bacterium]